MKKKGIRQGLKFILDEFVYGGHLLSFSAVGVILTSALLLNIRLSCDFLMISYLGSQTVYYYNHYKEFKGDLISNPERTEHIRKYRNFIPFIIFCFILIILAIIFFYKKTSIIYFVIILLLGGLLYTLFLKNYTKKIIAFKNIFASLIGALLVLFPVIYYYSLSYLNLSIFLLATFVFLKWFVTTSFLDIKDIESDRKEKFLTLPIILNREMLFKLLSLITILSLVPLVVSLYLDLLPKFSVVLILTIPYTFYYLRKIKSGNTNNIFLNYIFLDGEYIIWPIAIIFTKLFYV